MILKEVNLNTHEWNGIKPVIGLNFGMYRKILPKLSGVASGCTLEKSLGLMPYFTIYPLSHSHRDTFYIPEHVC